MNEGRKSRGRIRYFRVGMAVFLLVLIIIAIVSLVKCSRNALDEPSTEITEIQTSAASVTETQPEVTIGSEKNEEEAVPVCIYPRRTAVSKQFGEEYAVLFDATTGETVAYRNEDKKMFPASLTKVMTLIVAMENIGDSSERIMVTEDMIYSMWERNAQLAGLVAGESYSAEELYHALILNSGADAALALAVYAAGSEEEFVRLMNLKAEEMKLAGTHFTNPVGLHDEQHYSTAADMGTILAYAVQDDECRKILSAVRYEIPPSELDPEGIELESTMFSRMYGNEMPGVTIMGGKTGFTDEAGNCVESFAEVGGKTYILVLCNSKSTWNVVYDTLSAFSVYCADGEPYDPPEAY